MGNTLSYVNTGSRAKSPDHASGETALLRGQIRKLEDELKSLRKTSVRTSEKMAGLEEKVELPNVVII